MIREKAEQIPIFFLFFNPDLLVGFCLGEPSSSNSRFLLELKDSSLSWGALLGLWSSREGRTEGAYSRIDNAKKGKGAGCWRDGVGLLRLV